MNRKFFPPIECSKCGDTVTGNVVTDTDFRRQYDGKDYCVSCVVDVKLSEGAYAE